MMVTFISECEKKALIKTRRVLDSFANRIGNRTWQTIITSDGLAAVKKLLRQTASKNTAVACHWMRSNIRSDLVWIVGNRSKFNEQGIVPIASTTSTIINTEWENDWHYMPLIKALTALAALLHDWGKASICFQNKLKKPTNQSDPLRHEWVSCMLLQAFIGDDKSDELWLTRLADKAFDENLIEQNLKQAGPLSDLPNIAKLVVWLVISHHRLPLNAKSDKNEANNLFEIFARIDKNWGYTNFGEEAQCLEFKQGLLGKSQEWIKQVKKWAGRLLDCLPLAQQALNDGSYRLILQFSRLSLMLGDHNYSSSPANNKWDSDLKLYANTDPKSKVLKQKLDEHLVGVKEKALNIANFLPFFENKLEAAYDINFLKQKSQDAFQWQDKAAAKIKEQKKQNPQFGFFIVNMASTGCGKTIANAKIMMNLSEDAKSLRYILALGLRTLTLQTGDEYRNKIGLDNTNLAVLVGSVVQELHNHENNQKPKSDNYNNSGSESLESLVTEEIDYIDNIRCEDKLSTILINKKSKQFLYAPVLVCTIDHIIAATETKKGGRYILPFLRLMSSDLVIDEIDDFDGKDLVAIGRLIHLAGMLGRKVMISSATIPPALSEGYFNTYRKGWEIFSKTRNVTASINYAILDEFSIKTDIITNNQEISSYRKSHDEFARKRAQNLQDEKLTTIKRKGEIIEVCDSKDVEPSGDQFFHYIVQAAIIKHNQHNTIDPVTSKKISFGLIRMANIAPCVNLAQYLIDTAQWPDDLQVKVMAYHSNQVLLLRQSQEKHLDSVLKRKEKDGEMPASFENEIIRQHINNTAAPNVAFILVATPVEEVGRDHDFDWAIIEPSSFRSIVQLAGRVMRHRNKIIAVPNIGLMAKNLKAFKKEEYPYRRPGYESYQPKDGEILSLTTHDLNDLLQGCDISKAINAVPRILQPPQLKPLERLVDLEHKVIGDLLVNYQAYGPDTLEGWLNETWWLTAMPQYFVRFRASDPTVSLYVIYEDDYEDDKLLFVEKSDDGNDPKAKGACYNIQNDERSYDTSKLWLERDYKQLLKDYSDSMGKSVKEVAMRYGEINFRYREQEEYVYSDQFGLVKKM